jgi:hypothetical protein
MFEQTVVMLVHIQCYKCGVVFGVPDELNQRHKQKGDSFYCPNGHGQERALKDQLARARGRLSTTRERLEFVEHSRNSYRGHFNRIKRRVGNGVCPCCNRTFKDLARHMKSKHPSYTPEDSQ